MAGSLNSRRTEYRDVNEMIMDNHRLRVAKYRILDAGGASTGHAASRFCPRQKSLPGWFGGLFLLALKNPGRGGRKAGQNWLYSASVFSQHISGAAGIVVGLVGFGIKDDDHGF